jgi:hypothetical protein
MSNEQIYKKMTQTEPQVVETAQYELREAAKALKVSTSCVIKWTEKGLLRAKRKRLNGRRYWTGAEILRAWRAQM